MRQWVWAFHSLRAFHRPGLILIAAFSLVQGWDLTVIPSEKMIEKDAQKAVKLDCQALGLSAGDDPKLQWKDNQNNVVTSTSSSQTLYIEKSNTDKTKLTLHIPSLKKTLTGRYTCSGTARGQSNSVSRLLTVSGAPQFVQPRPGEQITAVNATLGLSIALRCQVLHQGSHAVKWYYEQHHQQLSSNNSILVPDSDRYSIIRPMGDLLGNSYNLQITKITKEDAGVYKCQIDGTDLEQKTKITVINAPPTQKPVRIPPANFTDCCIKKGVSANCLPVCAYGSADLSKFKLESCLLDIEKLLTCGSDKRNHIPCCRRRYVPEDCLDICMPEYLSLDLTHLKCVNYTMDVFRCYEEGQFLLPSPPTKLEVSAVTGGKLQVTWQLPEENSANVTGYKVFYRERQQTAYRSTPLIPANKRMYYLSNLRPGRYQVYVIATTAHGASVPSYIVEARTSSTDDTDIKPSQNESLSACCQRRGVAPTCQSMLCQGTPNGLDITKLGTCVNDVYKVLACVGGERNHSKCCVKRDVPTECLSMCMGQTAGSGASPVLSCLSYMSQISSCFQEGRSVLPAPPIGLSVSNVKLYTATVSWKPAALATSYIVTYKEKDAKGNGVSIQVSSSKQFSYAMNGLLPGRIYEVTVTSVNDKGSSLPSQRLIFLTHSEELPNPTSSPQDDYNVTACCQREGVREKCMDMCTYNVDTLVQMDAQHVLDCEADLVKLLACGADKRDHIPCCKRYRVTDVCLPLCRLTHDMNFTFYDTHMVCLQQTPNIVSCMKKGIDTRPGPPVNLTITKKTTNHIVLSWYPPIRAPKGVDYYMVEYKKKTDVNKPPMKIKKAGTVHRIILQNLDESTEYQMRVTAINEYGFSLPTPLISTFTLSSAPVTTVTPVVVPHPGNMSECCRRRGVNSYCQRLCEGQLGSHIAFCTADVDNLLQCAADGGDHRMCCRQSGVPDSCLHVCTGAYNGSSLLCLPYTLSVLSCFNKGRATLPSPPTQFTVLIVRRRYVILSWQPPTKNAQNVKYNVYLQTIEKKMTNVTKDVMQVPYNLTGLTPGTRYRVYVVAVNEHGASLASDVITFYSKEEYAPIVKVEQSPSGILDLKDHVILKCGAEGAPPPVVSWKRQDVVTIGSNLVLDHVGRAAAGRYTCIAENGIGKPVTADLFLKIRYKPMVKSASAVVSQTPNAGLQTVLVCDFWGYPTQIKWYFNDEEVPPKDGASVYRTRVVENLLVTEASLQLLLVRSHHLGLYTCEGRNSLGSVSTSIRLQATPNSAPVQPFPPPHNITKCCMESGVDAACQGICTTRVRLHHLQALTPRNMLTCQLEMPRMLHCAANGHNNSRCCQGRRVSAECVPFCSGRVPDLTDAQKIRCLDHLQDIVYCLDSGNVLAPGPPVDVKARLVKGQILVEWQKPKTNPDAVKAYVVYYRMTPVTDATAMPLVMSSRTEATKLSISYLRTKTRYVISVKAMNTYHDSHLSSNVTVITSELFPAPPPAVEAHVVKGTGVNVKVMWKEPLGNAGATILFHVYYRVAGTNQGYKRIDVADGYSALLENLSPETKYEIHVTSNNTEHESEPSETVYIKTTAEVDVLPPLPHQDGSSKSVKIGVSVFLVLLAIGIILAVFLVYHLRIKRKTLRFKESVSFENPGYVRSVDANERVEITGLPDEPMCVNHQTSNGHGPVRNGKHNLYGVSCDTHSDNSYSELAPPQFGNSHPLDHECATLDVSQTETLDGVQIPHDGSLSRI